MKDSKGKRRSKERKAKERKAKEKKKGRKKAKKRKESQAVALWASPWPWIALAVIVCAAVLARYPAAAVVSLLEAFRRVVISLID